MACMADPGDAVALLDTAESIDEIILRLECELRAVPPLPCEERAWSEWYLDSDGNFSREAFAVTTLYVAMLAARTPRD
jgi:hypothetical protein